MSVSVMNNNISNNYAEDDAQVGQPFFVRALFDFQGSDASSLSFRRGDIIEVLNTLESGWWDGLLDDERGWFPSNYVQAISDAEADQELAIRFQNGQHAQALEAQAHALEAQRTQREQRERERERDIQLREREAAVQQQQRQRQYTLQQQTHPNTGGTRSAQGRYHEEETHWLDEQDHHHHQTTHQQDPRATQGATGRSSDFWVPQGTNDGQVSTAFPQRFSRLVCIRSREMSFYAAIRVIYACSIQNERPRPSFSHAAFPRTRLDPFRFKLLS